MSSDLSGQSSLALASLTATYTDSEPEEEEEEGNEVDSGSSSGVLTPTKVQASNCARLVSYHDDTVISDDDVGLPADIAQRRKSALAELEREVPPEGIQLYPEPPGRCSNELQEKINRLYEKMQSGLDMNSVIQERKDFRNPSIYEKLIQFCGINELGTNYPPHLYDPQRWGKESFYEELSKVQKAEMEKHEKERKEKTKVEFVSGTAKRPGSGSGTEDEAKRRKSKWDQVGLLVSGSSGQTNILKPAGFVQQPSLTSSVTGTKGTVISAFGSLPKKK